MGYNFFDFEKGEVLAGEKPVSVTVTVKRGRNYGDYGLYRQLILGCNSLELLDKLNKEIMDATIITPYESLLLVKLINQKKKQIKCMDGKINAIETIKDKMFKAVIKEEGNKVAMQWNDLFNDKLKIELNPLTEEEKHLCEMFKQFVSVSIKRD